MPAASAAVAAPMVTAIVVAPAITAVLFLAPGMALAGNAGFGLLAEQALEPGDETGRLGRFRRAAALRPEDRAIAGSGISPVIPPLLATILPAFVAPVVASAIPALAAPVVARRPRRQGS